MSRADSPRSRLLRTLLPRSDRRRARRHKQQRQTAPRTVAEARAVFAAYLSAPAEPSGAPEPQPQTEDGEILQARPPPPDEAAAREQRVHAGLNLALLEALNGRGAAALAAGQDALAAAEGAQPARQPPTCGAHLTIHQRLFEVMLQPSSPTCGGTPCRWSAAATCLVGAAAAGGASTGGRCRARRLGVPQQGVGGPGAAPAALPAVEGRRKPAPAVPAPPPCSGLRPL